MHTETGSIIDDSKLEAMSPAERAKYIPVRRDLTKVEEARRSIGKYAPCGCGSGKKFKFCCFQKPATPPA